MTLIENKMQKDRNLIWSFFEIKAATVIQF